jgi:hypothetical protein
MAVFKSSQYKSSQWWKFDRYTISGGAVRPARGAARQAYDPWQIFESARGKYRKVKTLWGDFVELGRQIRADAGTSLRPSVTGEALILEWCNNYGLLGILPGQAQFISLVPTYEQVDRDSAVNLARSPRAMVQRSFGRVAGAWVGHHRHIGRADAVTVEPDWRAAKAVPQTAWVRGIEPARTLFWDWSSFEWRNDEGNQRLASFFSFSAKNGQYPRPLSADFWSVYQEPVWAWTQAALLFSEAVELVSQYAAARFARRPLDEATLPRVDDALWMLNSLSASETYSYEFGALALQRQLTSSSLLAVMAEMFFLDLMAGRRAIRCQRCDTIFVSNDARAAYCTVTCRNTARTRRARTKAAREEAARRRRKKPPK